jgi:hypothetical protein
MSESTMAVWDDGSEQLEAPLGEGDLDDLVSRLDGRNCTLVTLFVGGGHAACGGDARTGLVVYVTLDGERFHQLVRGDEDSDGEVAVVAGGQLGHHPARSVVSAERAIEALRWYVDHHELMPSAEWETS